MFPQSAANAHAVNRLVHAGSRCIHDRVKAELPQPGEQHLDDLSSVLVMRIVPSLKEPSASKMPATYPAAQSPAGWSGHSISRLIAATEALALVLIASMRR